MGATSSIQLAFHFQLDVHFWTHRTGLAGGPSTSGLPKAKVGSVKPSEAIIYALVLQVQAAVSKKIQVYKWEGVGLKQNSRGSQPQGIRAS